MTTRELLRLEHVSKISGNLKVLDDLSLLALEGEQLQITGLSDSGIQELAQLLAGRTGFDSGRIHFQDRVFGPEQRLPAAELGIHLITDTPALIPDMSVAENIFCLRPHSLFSKTPSRRVLRRQAEMLLQEFSLDIPPEAPVYDLQPVEQHVLDFIRAYARGAKLILITGALHSYPENQRRIFEPVTQHLREKNVTVISLSPDPGDVYERTIVLRDGTHSKTIYQQFPTRADIMRYAVEGELPEPAPRKSNVGQETAFICRNLCLDNLKNITFSVRRGEIVGIFDSASADLPTALEAMLTGAQKPEHGHMILGGRPFAPKDLNRAVKSGLGYISGTAPESQLLEHISVSENILLPSMKKAPLLGIFRNPSAEKSLDSLLHDGDLTGLSHVPVQDLPPQNDLLRTIILYHRWGIYRPRLLLYSDPFNRSDQVLRGKILERIEHLTALNIGMLILSPRLRDLVYLCDRILLYKEGVFQQELVKKDNQFPGLNQLPK